MRTLWNLFSFLAVVHILALILFLAWLWQSDRLTAARLSDAKGMFAMTVAEAEEAAKKAEEEANAERDKQSEEDRRASPPVDSAAQLQYLSILKQEEEQAKRRLGDEKNMLLQQVKAVSGQISEKQEALDRERKMLDSSAKDERQRKNDEQFMQTVRQIEQLPPKQGKRMLAELVNQKQMDQAVAYLAAMNPRGSSKILKEFKTDQEIVLATELLERMRTKGSDTREVASAAGANARGPEPKASTEPPGNASPPANPTP